MGGYGSGLAWGATPKTCVEECYSLNVDQLRKAGIIPHWGTWCNKAHGWVWKSSSGERLASVGLEVRALNDDARSLTVRYSVNGEPVELEVWLDSTPQHFGGSRWWFTCPLLLRGVPCRRRVGRLYLPPGGRYFGCRHCYDLTYESAQEAHKFDALFSNTGYSAKEVAAALRG